MASGECQPTAGPVDELTVTFFGVRGSTPCCTPDVNRYGGNTSCVAVDAPGSEPILLDLGTGARVYGQRWPRPRPFRGRALVSHLHWDHVQGLPFFGPALSPGSRLDIYAPPPGSGMTLMQAFDACIRPPFFPVRLRDLAGSVRLHETTVDVPIRLDSTTVTARTVPHAGPTVGYRIEWCGVALAYIPDHQQPGPDATEVDPAVLELARGVDVLIHDAQYTPAEFEDKATWGHSTVQYAVEVARQAEVRTLALFHHDPLHDDHAMDRILGEARIAAGCGTFDVIAAQEGLRLTFASRLRYGSAP